VKTAIAGRNNDNILLITKQMLNEPVKTLFRMNLSLWKERSPWFVSEFDKVLVKKRATRECKCALLQWLSQSASLPPRGSGLLAAPAITMIGFTHYKWANLAIPHLCPLHCNRNRKISPHSQTGVLKSH